jgi:hypothetical protein
MTDRPPLPETVSTPAGEHERYLGSILGMCVAEGLMPFSEQL